MNTCLKCAKRITEQKDCLSLSKLRKLTMKEGVKIKKECKYCVNAS